MRRKHVVFCYLFQQKLYSRILRFPQQSSEYFAGPTIFLNYFDFHKILVNFLLAVFCFETVGRFTNHGWVELVTLTYIRIEVVCSLKSSWTWLLHCRQYCFFLSHYHVLYRKSTVRGFCKYINKTWG